MPGVSEADGRSRGFGRIRPNDDAPEPVEVSGGLTFGQMAPGEEFTCGLTLDGIAHCWGSNRAGWLGDGTIEDRLEPTPVQPAQ